MGRRARGALAIAAILVAAGCSRPDFDPTDGEAFATSCVDSATRVSGALAMVGVRPAVAAAVMAMSATPPAAADLPRRFDPGRPPAVAGSDAVAADDVVAQCRSMAASRDRFEGVGAWTALDAGLSRWMSALSTQLADAKSLKDQIRESVEGRRRASGHVADLIGRFAPHGTSYTVSQQNGHPAPAIVMDAVNPLDKSIEAMFLAIDLKRPDGSVMAQGRLTFTPATPLAPGVQSTYLVGLDGVAGFSNTALADLRGSVGIGIKVEDVVSDGVRILGDTLMDPQDGRRLEALSVLQGRVADVRDFVRRIREKESTNR